jgi:hypothetical protein
MRIADLFPVREIKKLEMLAGLMNRAVSATRRYRHGDDVVIVGQALRPQPSGQFIATFVLAQRLAG